MKNILLALIILASSALADENKYKPVTLRAGSSLTLDAGVAAVFKGPVDFTLATVTGLDLSGGSFQPIDPDLTAIAALAGTNTIYYRSGANTWSAVTIGGNMTFAAGLLNSNAAGLPSQTGQNGKFLKTDGTSASWAVPAGGGSGDASTDTASSVVGELSIFKDTSGKVLGRSTGTGLLKITSGVAATAAASDVNTLINSTVAPVFANVSSKPTTLAGYGITDGLSGLSATGDVTGTSSGTTIATTIASHAVTNAKSAQMAANTFKGNNTNVTADAKDLTTAQMKTALALNGTNTGDQTITLTGQVTGTGTGSFATTLNKTAITALTEDTTPSLPNDFFLSYDLSGDGLKKVKMTNVANQLSINTVKDSVDPTKQLFIDVSGFPTLTTFTFTLPSANSVGVVASSASTLQAAIGVSAGGVISYDNFTSRVATVTLTGQTASKTTTNFLGSSPSAGLYRIIYYIRATTAGTSGTADVTIAFNDGVARTDVNTAAITFGTTAFATRTVIVLANGATQVTYAVALNSPVGSPVYAFNATMERLQ